MYEIAIVVLLLLALAMVALILVQQGKGAGIGASFGAGASNTVFGAAGSGNFLTRSTWTLSILFFAVCLFIGWLQKEEARDSDSFSSITAPLPAAGAEGDRAEAAPGDTEVPQAEDAPAAGAAPADDGGGQPAGRSDAQGAAAGDVPLIGDE